MQYNTALRRLYGFTLIELLIALFIFTIISTIMVSSLHTLLSTQAHTEQNAARFSELQMALVLMARDFEQALDRPITSAADTLENAFVGSYSTATFTHGGLANPLGKLQRSTLQRTQYLVINNKLIRKNWAALDQTVHTSTSSRELLTDVTDLHFEYLDKNGKFEERWPLDQPTPPELPRAVRMYLTLRDLGKISQTYVIPAQKPDKPN